MARFLSPLIEAFCLHKKHKLTKVSPIENQVFVKIRIRNEISSYLKADRKSAKSVRISVWQDFSSFGRQIVRFTASRDEIKVFIDFSMLVKVLFDQNELRTTQNPARTAFQKYQKATKKEGSCNPGDWSSLRADPDRFVRSPSNLAGSPWGRRFAPPFGRWICSAPLRGFAPPLRGTDPPPERLRSLLPHSEPAKLDSDPAKSIRIRAPVGQIARIPIIL